MRWLRPLMLVLSLAFVIVAAVDLSRRWDGRNVSVDVPLAALAMLPILFGNFIQGAGWIVLVERMASRATPRLAAMALYLDSQLARYAPGKVGLPLVRMEGAPRLGLSRSLVGVSVFIEAISWLATGAITGLSLLVVFGAPREGLGALAGPWLLPALGAALAGGVVLVTVDRRRLPRAVCAKLGLDGEGAIVPLRLPLVQIVYWCTWAVHGYVLALALGAPAVRALDTVAFVPLAAVLGMVAVAAPAGVGVREAVLAFGLAPVLGGAGALAAALLSRVLFLAADVLAWLSARIAVQRWPSRAEPLAPPEP